VGCCLGDGSVRGVALADSSMLLASSARLKYYLAATRA
jgi:hypothetical protein